jgi:dephospho-CoA kinase
MLRVGLTGGLASGKSFVGHTLAGLGCLLIQADELGRQVQEPGGEAYAAVVREFGPGILAPEEPGGAGSGSARRIDRRRLAAEVFRDPERLHKLNALVHPHVHVLRRKREEDFARAHPDGIAVTEAAILIETGSYRDYDRLIVAFCRPGQQIERAMSRDHLTHEEVLDRMRQQMPLEEKMKYADYLVDTSGAKADTVAQTEAVYNSLLGLTTDIESRV